jgi:hypothetical protein
MRLSWSALLAFPLLCSGSCEGNSCGPTSEWPTCGTGDNASGTDDEGQGNGNTPPKDDQSTGGGRKDAGRGPGSWMDAGASKPEPPPLSGEESENAADAGDAGDAGVDARVGSFDGGLEGCTIDSDGRDAGACFGVYCDVAQSTFSALASDQGACLSQSELALACDGELARVVASCAQDDVLMLGFGRTVALCAARAPSLASASEACIGCYVDEMLCALQRCLAPCLSGSSAECTRCRRESCGSDFSSCSGLPE